MTGIETAMLVSAIASALGSAFGGGGGQDRESFKNQRHGTQLNLDPRAVLGDIMTTLGRQGANLEDRATSPISLPGAYAQPLPIYSGGGLPFPIGATGRDPALDNPAQHLSIPGMAGRDIFTGLGGRATGGQMPRADERQWEPPPGWGGPWTNQQAGRDLLKRGGTPPDDMDQAEAAFQLLGVK